jgi:hypothetical protein
MLRPEDGRSCCSAQSESDRLLKINSLLIETYEEILCLYEDGDGLIRARNIVETAMEDIFELYSWHNEKAIQDYQTNSARQFPPP